MSKWRLLLDENIDPKAATYLEKEGIHAEHVRDALWQGADDEADVLPYARDILGGVSLLRVIPVERSLVHRDGAALVCSTLVGFAVLFDRTVTAVEGALLTGLFVAYTA